MTVPWIQYVTLDNLPNEDMEILAAIIGLEAIAKVICELEGATLIVPQQAARAAKIEYVKANYDGTRLSRRNLSKQCNFSENFIYRIAKKRN